MGVVFDEVVTEVATPPRPSPPRPERGAEEGAPNAEERRWQQHQATFWRRRQRLQAD